MEGIEEQLAGIYDEDDEDDWSNGL
jgi:hypothetical protein